MTITDGSCIAHAGAGCRCAALEATGFHPARSGRDHLRVYCTINGYPQTRADQILEQVGLTGAASRAAGGYSLGMRQRLALATALLGDPRILVLDEPANGLDPEGIAWMRGFLKSLAAQGRTILISSHVLSEVQQLVDHVIVLNRGRLVRRGPLAELAAPEAATTVRTPQAGDLMRVLHGASDDGVRVSRDGPQHLTVTGMTPAQIGHLAHRERFELHELAPTRDDLEQIFLTLTRAAKEPHHHRMPVINMAFGALLEGGVAGTALAAACRRWARRPRSSFMALATIAPHRLVRSAHHQRRHHRDQSRSVDQSHRRRDHHRP